MSELDSLYANIVLRANEWRPKFVEVDSVEECARLINKPHEDYPRRVPETEFCLHAMSTIKEENPDEGFLFMIHSTIMKGLESRGRYRTKNVNIVGTSGYVNEKGELETKREIIYTPPDWLAVPALMSRIMPLDQDPVWWYALFQSIHPFEDGNGRVGGVIVGYLSYLKTGKYLSPLQ